MDIVYEFWYNDCIYESSAFTVSIHRTRKGAEMALEYHKAKIKKKHDDLYKDEEPDMIPFDYDWGKAWGIKETEVLE